ncbi:MAG: PorV/PorQ family protein [Candidatus Marinimicrobia bacterium]|nr:PorV/PorQ family protein [Candidatus Neomarinimicrobiota bacterium]MCF7839853.1 PorV/PorQ family protein [Candidatus Neomarinimicrobiota bacterium]MCF7902559.1 PorV/PorQ family protein [Candidatus Neomarinimicrobiota bacterium]
MIRLRITFGFLVLFLGMETLPAATSGYHLLTFPFSTRSAGMGGTYAAASPDQFQLFTNPAAAALTTGFQAFTGSVRHLADIQGVGLGGVVPVEQHRFFGEAIYFNYGTFDRTDEHNTQTGTFGFHELYVGGGYALDILRQFALGGRLGVYSVVVDNETQQTLVSSVGGMYHVRNDSTTIGIALMNFGANQGADELPTTLVVGGSQQLMYLPARIHLDAQMNRQQQWRVAVGGELFVQENFSLRAGLNSNRFDLQTNVLRSDFIAGGTAGFSLTMKKLSFEFALQSFGGAGVVQQMSLAVKL